MTYCCSLTLPHDCLKTRGGEFPTRETTAAEAHVGENSINMVTGLNYSRFQGMLWCHLSAERAVTELMLDQ